MRSPKRRVLEGGNGVPPRLRRFCALAIASQVLLGCAVTVLDDDGTRRIVGFVNMELPGPGESAGAAVDVSTLGVLVFRSPISLGVSIGYTRERLVGLKNNVLVRGDPFRPTLTQK